MRCCSAEALTPFHLKHRQKRTLDRIQSPHFMKFALLFIFIAFAIAYPAFQRGGAVWLMAWPALSFMLAGLAYAGLGPRVFGKRLDGTLSPVWLPMSLPFLMVVWSLWHARRAISRSSCVHEVAPGLWLGRRLGPHELPEGVTTVVDLTAEFWEPADVRIGRRYICLPTLDATCSDEREFRQVLDHIAATKETVFIHCAQGLGRSASLAAALLIQKGLASDVADAERRLAASRPGVRLTPCQRRLVECVTRGQPVSSTS
jgi:protein-tyrosine phosphatase